MTKSSRTLKLFICVLCLFAGSSSYAGVCLILGDSQSALSIEKNAGLAPALVSGLKERGHQSVFYALKGVGASDWIIAPEDNKNTLIGEPLKNNPDQLRPFQIGGDPIALRQNGRVPFIDQLWKHHQDQDLSEKFDCFMIQLGDNDLFRQSATDAISEIVKHIKGKDHAPRTCRIIGPSFKESGERDQYPFITDGKKKFYMTKLRHRLQKEGLLEECPLIDGLNTELRNELRDLGRPFTNDGLYYNRLGGTLWAKNILKKVF